MESININQEEVTEEMKTKTLQEIKNTCSQCEICELHKGRTNIVFSDGNPNSKLMLIGEAPGRQEDETGIPFVGRAGKLLDQFLKEQGITRENDIYICNTVKCRPPENRVPKQTEKASCRDYLDAQINLIRPKLILLCGATALKSFIQTKDKISQIRGELFDGPFGAKMMPIFHPSYLLRNHSLEPGRPRALMKADIAKAKAFIS